MPSPRPRETVVKYPFNKHFLLPELLGGRISNWVLMELSLTVGLLSDR
jgi:hypothetical protein